MKGAQDSFLYLIVNAKKNVFNVEAFENTGVKTGHTTKDIKAIASGRRHWDVWGLVCLIIGSN